MRGLCTNAYIAVYATTIHVQPHKIVINNNNRNNITFIALLIVVVVVEVVIIVIRLVQLLL